MSGQTMRRITITFGTVASVLALGLGLFGTGFGTAMASPGFQTAVIMTPILLAAGTGLVLVAPGVAAGVLLFGTFGLLYSFGLNFVTAVPVLFAVLATALSAVMAFRRARDAAAGGAVRDAVQLSGGNRRQYPP